MTASLFALAAAVLMAPGGVGRRRLLAVRRSQAWTWRGTSALGSVVLAASVAAVLFEPLPALAAALVTATVYRRWRARLVARRGGRPGPAGWKCARRAAFG